MFSQMKLKRNFFLILITATLTVTVSYTETACTAYLFYSDSMAEILNICTENTFCANTSASKCTTLTPALFLRLSDLFYSCKCTQAPVVKKTLYCEVIKNIFSNF